jgi:pilus assembly protein CpaE
MSPRPLDRGPVVVLGASGGCGASTVAGALALCWAVEGTRPWLVELDLERGDLAGAWDLPRERTVADLAPVAAELDAGHVRAAAFPHPSGVVVLAGPGAPGAEAGWDRSSIHRLVEVVAGQGRVAVDAGPGLSPVAAAAVERAGRILVVCAPTLAAARRSRRLIEAAAERGAEGRTAVVVAQGPSRAEIGARALGRALGASVAAELPWAHADAGELGAGRWPSGRRRPLRAAVERLAEALA